MASDAQENKFDFGLSGSPPKASDSREDSYDLNQASIAPPKFKPASQQNNYAIDPARV